MIGRGEHVFAVLGLSRLALTTGLAIGADLNVDLHEVLAHQFMAQAIAATWPENIAVSRFCCRLISHDEATIGAFVDAASEGDRMGFEAALTGLLRPERMHRLWEGALALTAAELRAV